MRAVFERCPRGRSPWVFPSPRTRQLYTVNGLAHVFRRAVARAGITTGDVTLHTLRHNGRREPGGQGQEVPRPRVEFLAGRTA